MFRYSDFGTSLANVQNNKVRMSYPMLKNVLVVLASACAVCATANQAVAASFIDFEC